jgi:uncharacterized protein YeaO (DUF488 family)
MAIAVVRLGSPRHRNEGPRIGTVRRPPRGVKQRDYAKLDYYDVWLPDLSPSAKLVRLAQSGEWTKFTRLYRREMREQSRLLGLLAALSRTANFSVGCYCEDESRCHRSLLREILVEHGARIAK